MKRRNIKLTIEYDGTDFSGWQIQGQPTAVSSQPPAISHEPSESCNLRTIQGELKKFLEKICKEEIIVLGSGRTDSGVHASGQVAHFRTTTDKSCALLLRALNANLPQDISVTEVKEVSSRFHAQFSAKSKTYRYTILNRASRSALLHRHSLFYPHKLNVTLMKEEACCLIGRHDFKSFQASDTASKKRGEDTIRTIKRLEIKKRAGIITIDIEANGFLYKMVRNITGTLLSIGSGLLPKGSTKKILRAKDRRQAPAPAKAEGLCLLQVMY